MSNTHEGRVALITGAGRGIGKAYAKRLAEDGLKLAIVDREGADAAAQELSKGNGAAAGFECDVSSPESVDVLRAAVLERFGRVDVLVNNAGICPWTPWADMDFDAWRSVLSVNLDSLFLTTKAFVPAMQERGWGRVINVSSGTFWLASPFVSHYIASKAGVIGYTRALATEVGQSGVTVNAVSPGLVRTAMTESTAADIFEVVAGQQAIKRVQEPEDLVGAVSFLASDDAAFITGQTMSVDGGLVRL